MSPVSFLELPDGAQIAYEVFGKEKSGKPIVLVGGLSSMRGDWARIAPGLAERRPVLVFDNRGIGDSRLSGKQDEKMTIESMARDLLYLINSLGWKELSICGFSMGGVITQQLLFLPYHPTNPTQIPIITHVVLAGTFCATLKDPNYGLNVTVYESMGRDDLTIEDKKAIVRSTVESTLDPQWVKDPANQARLDSLLERATHKGPYSTILMQRKAVSRFDFSGLHEKLPRNMKFLVIFGGSDRVVPPSSRQDILNRIPWAKAVEIGKLPGQVPSNAFGHLWMEYFDKQVWLDVINYFVEDKDITPKARL